MRKILIMISILLILSISVKTQTTAGTLDTIFPQIDYKIKAPVESRTYGATWPKRESYAMAGCYGFTIERDPKTQNAMILSTYMLDWNEKTPEGNLTVQRLTGSKPTGEKFIIKENMKINETIPISLPDEGKSYILTWETPACDVQGYVTNENGKACAMRPDLETTNNPEWENIKKTIIKEQALKENILYPFDNNAPTYVHREEEIKQLSDRIISEKEQQLKRKTTDSEKLFLFTKYIQDNYAFDRWRMNQKDGKTTVRYRLTDNNTNNPMNFAYDSHVGVCWDYMCILNIMARHHKIPAVGMMNPRHAMSVIYIDNEWMGFDISAILRNECITKNTDKNEWISNINRETCKKSLTCDPRMKEIFITYSMWDNDKEEAEESYKILTGQE